MKRIAFVALGAAVVFACGGVTVDPLDDGGTDKDGSPGTDAPSPYCPSSPPSEGSACPKSGLYCEYGSDPNLACNITAQCVGGTWMVQKPYGQCPTPPNPTSCPASFASVPTGQLCGNLVGTTCEYPQGFCGCAVPSGGPYPEDASAVARWVCDSPAPGCPMPRPKLGTSCNQNGLQCDYSPCDLPSGASLVCQDGAWENQPYGCAL